jgi:transposase
MRQVRAVLRLTWAWGLSARKIAPSVRGSRLPVAEDVRRAQAAGLAGPRPATLDETALERPRFATAAPTPIARRPIPDWTVVHQALKRQGVTWLLVWPESNASPPKGRPYSQFWAASRQGAGQLARGMRQSHRAGETLFGA